MTTTEAQKRAYQKWKENNNEKMREYQRAWRVDNEDYRLKQIQYSLKYQRKRRALQAEFKRLSAIQIWTPTKLIGDLGKILCVKMTYR